MTAKQTSLYWRTFSAACVSMGIQGKAEREEYRHRVLREEAGVTSTKQVGTTTAFDAVMARMASDAGDWQGALKYGAGSSYRMAVMVQICLAQVMQLKGLPDGSAAARDYLNGVLEQSHIAPGKPGESFWLDLGPAALLRVFQILDTHRRRLIRQHTDVTSFIGFDPTTAYRINADGTISIMINKNVYDQFRS